MLDSEVMDGLGELLNNTSCTAEGILHSHPPRVSKDSGLGTNTTSVSSLKAEIIFQVEKNELKSSFNTVCSFPFSSFICFNHCLDFQLLIPLQLH